MIDDDLRDYLLASASVTTSTSNRIHIDHMPQESTFPAIWGQITNQDEALTMDGADGVMETSIRLDVMTTNCETTETLTDHVKAWLHGYSGTMGLTEVEGVFVRSVRSDFAYRDNAEDEGIFIGSLDTEIHHPRDTA